MIHAFRAVDDFAQTQIHYRKTVANFRRRYELRAVMPILRAWHEKAAERAEHKKIMKQATFTLYRRLVTECWVTWANIIHERKLQEREMAAKGSKTLMRIVKRPMVRCFEAWMKLYEEERRNREIFARISYRWQNAEVVSTFSNWVIFVDIAIEERREALRAAVLEAMQCGDLATLLRTARQQQRSYQRANLEEVMREVLAEEHGQISHLNRGREQPARRDRGGAGGMPRGRAAPGGVPPGKKARHESESLSPLRAREKQRGGGAVSVELSAEYGYPGDRSPQHRGGGAMAMPDFIDEPAGRGGQERRQERSAGGQKKKMTQILPPYLRGAVPHRTMPAGGGSVRYQTGEASPRDGGGSWRGGETRESRGGQGVSDALSATMPSGGDPIRDLDVGDATAYPLLGFDAELPARDANGVKATLSQFESAARRDLRGGKKGTSFPAIKKGKAAWPQIDDSDDANLGLAGSIADAREDLSLPRVVAAPVPMPMMMDD